MKNNEFKNLRIKNCTYYNFDDIIKLEDFDVDNMLKDDRTILIYDISYKTLIGEKPLRIRFDKIDGFIRIYNGTTYLILFGSEKYDANYNRIRYLVSLKRDIKYIFCHCYVKTKNDCNDSLPIDSVIILIKSVLNKNKNHYYYKIILEKRSYQLVKK